MSLWEHQQNVCIESISGLTIPSLKPQNSIIKNRHKKPRSETDIPISEAVRPPQGFPALPFVNGSPKEVRSFSEYHDFAVRVRQAEGVFYHSWGVKVYAGKVEGLAEYHMSTSSLTQIQNPGKKLNQFLFFLNIQSYISHHTCILFCPVTIYDILKLICSAFLQVCVMFLFPASSRVI